MSRHGVPELTDRDRLARLEHESRLLAVAVPDALGAELLSRSDSACVYRVVGADLGSLVVKLVDPASLPAVTATIARIGGHAALVPLRHSGRDARRGYLVFPFYGQSLADRIDAGPVPPTELGRLLAPVADALAQLHRAGLVHADIKPANLLLTGTGEAVLADLDEVGELGSVPRRVTVGFCPPEQISGRPLAVANDTYSFTSTVLTSLTGGTGWLADPPGWLASAAASRLQSALLQALRAGIATDPAARRTDPGQLVAALAGDTVAARAAPRLSDRTGRPDRTAGPSAGGSTVEPELVVAERQVLTPALLAAPRPGAGPSSAGPATAGQPAVAGQLSDLAAAAHQVWGFVDLRAATSERLALQLQEPDPEPELAPAQRPIWRHPAMIASTALAALLIVLGVCLMIWG